VSDPYVFRLRVVPYFSSEIVEASRACETRAHVTSSPDFSWGRGDVCTQATLFRAVRHRPPVKVGIVYCSSAQRNWSVGDESLNVSYLAQLSFCCLAPRRIALSASVCQRKTIVLFFLCFSKSERRSIDDLPKALDPSV